MSIAHDSFIRTMHLQLLTMSMTSHLYIILLLQHDHLPRKPEKSENTMRIRKMSEN